MILGLSGGYCAGKSLAAAILEKRGWINIEMDWLGHRALEQSMDEVQALLGPSVRKPDGSPNRRAIGALVFADPALLELYEAIVHPQMNRLCAQALDEQSAATGTDGAKLIVNAAILYRLPIASRCQLILEVRAPLLVRIRRGMLRDNLSAQAVLSRIRAQAQLWPLGKSLGVRLVRLCNWGSSSALERKLQRTFLAACLPW